MTIKILYKNFLEKKRIKKHATAKSKMHLSETIITKTKKYME